MGGRFVRLGDTEREAWAELNRRLADRGEGPVRSRVTVEELADLWLDAKHADIKPNTWEKYQAYAQSLVDHCGQTLARDLRPLHVSGWLKAHPKWGGVRELAMGVVKMMTRWGKREGWLDADPLAEVTVKGAEPRKPAPEGAIEGLEAGIRSERFREILAFMLATGVRPGEARTLEAARIDFGAAMAVVRGKRGERPIVLPGSILGLLRDLCERHPTGPIFRNTLGEPWQDRALSEQFRACRRRAGIKGEVVPYHCRGIFASRAYAAGVDGVTVAKLLGHRDTSRLAILIRHYLSVDQASLASAVERASASSVVAPSRPPPDSSPGTPPGPARRS